MFVNDKMNLKLEYLNCKDRNMDLNHQIWKTMIIEEKLIDGHRFQFHVQLKIHIPSVHKKSIALLKMFDTTLIIL